MERKNQRISDLFYNNRFLLVFSVVAAIALWLVIAVEYGPEATNTVDVNVQADFEYIKKSLDLECFGNYDKTVKVTIKGQRVVVDSDDIKNQIIAKLQTDSITRVGEVPVTINITKDPNSFSDFEIVDSSASAYYKLFFDKKLDEDFPVIPQIPYISNGENKYIPDSVAFNYETKTISVSGPASKVKNIKSVVARYDESVVLNETTEIYAQILLLDFNGNIINPDDNYITLSAKEIKVTIPVYDRKNIQIGYKCDNKPAKYIDGKFDPFTVSFTPSYAEVALSESLNVNDVLEVYELDYSEIFNGVYKPEDVSVADMNGCIFLDGTEKISVVVDASHLGDKIMDSPDISTVRFENAPDGKKISVVSIDFETVRMIGPKESVDILETKDLTVTADLSEVPNDFEGQIQVNAFVETDDCWSYGKDYSVTVNIE